MPRFYHLKRKLSEEEAESLQFALEATAKFREDCSVFAEAFAGFVGRSPWSLGIVVRIKIDGRKAERLCKSAAEAEEWLDGAKAGVQAAKSGGKRRLADEIADGPPKEVWRRGARAGFSVWRRAELNAPLVPTLFG